jgi:hypothetical protein
MGSPNAKRRLFIYVTLIGCGLGVCAWQFEEHARFKREAENALINRASDITSTLGVVVRSQQRFSPMVSKDRLESALKLLVSDELKAITILAATGQPIASAGSKMELPGDILQPPGVHWEDRTLTVMNPTDLGSPATDDLSRPRPPIVVTDERLGRERLPSRRSQPVSTEVPMPAADGGPAPVTPAESRPLMGRPYWMMTAEQIQKQGVHAIVISLSTEKMHRAVNADLLLRSMVSLLAMGGAMISSLAWRNVGKNSELQIRLIKAGEMNTHLKEMNLAAAGLAHETRNPLNLIRGLAQMISMEAKDTPKLKEHASIILEEADRVTVQLNEFINYSKPRNVQLAPVDVQRLVADLARTLVPDIEEKQIVVQQPESALIIDADEQLLRQALFNVLLNAIQAVSLGGRVEVRLATVGSREAILEIRDDGPGVPAADRVSIFKPYITMRPRGVGLGLAIVAQIAAVHHWEVSCEANEPRGACFRFSGLKLAAAPT